MATDMSSGSLEDLKNTLRVKNNTHLVIYLLVRVFFS